MLDNGASVMLLAVDTLNFSKFQPTIFSSLYSKSLTITIGSGAFRIVAGAPGLK